MDSNPIHHPSPAKEWNAHFWITFNFWWLAGLVNGLKPHPQSPSSQRMKCSFLDYVQLLMIGRAGQCTQNPSTTPLQPKNEMPIFGLRSTSDDGPGWSMDSNPICNLSATKNMKCLFLDYVQLLMIGQAGRWTETPSTTPLQPKNEMLIFGLLSILGHQPGWSMDSNAIHHPSPAKEWNAHFWMTFNFCWPVGLVNGLKPHLPPLSSQKMKCLFLLYVQLLMISWAGRWTRIPSATPFKPKKWNAHFCITFNFWLLGWSLDSNTIHLPSQAKKNEMLIFGLHLTSDDWQGCSMDSNPICHPSPAKKMKCLFLDYVQLLMIGEAGRWTQTPSATPLQPKNEMLIFGLLSISGDQPGWSMDSNPIHHPSPAKEWNAHFWMTFNFWWPVGLVNGLKPHLPPLSSQKNEMLVFGLCSTSDDQLGWSMDSNPICHPFQAKKWNAHFCITFNFWWLGWSLDSNTIHLPSQAKKMKCSFLDYI